MALVTKEHSPEVKNLLEELKKKGIKIQSLPAPNLEEVEPLYYEIKELLRGNFEKEEGDVSNSLAEYAMLVWNVRNKRVEGNAIFVTRNFSLILNRDRLEERYGIQIISLDEMKDMAKKRENGKQE